MIWSTAAVLNTNSSLSVCLILILHLKKLFFGSKKSYHFSPILSQLKLPFRDISLTYDLAAEFSEPTESTTEKWIHQKV